MAIQDTQIAEENVCASPQKLVCRICLMEEGAEDDSVFVTNLCACKGSCGTYHLKCFQTWINKRIVLKQIGNATGFLWKKMECEVCKKSVPYRVKKNDELYDLIEMDKVDEPYVILESISREKKCSSGIYVVRFPGNDSVKLVSAHSLTILRVKCYSSHREEDTRVR
eukprot:TRINITY_DN1653_c0_g1_i7.p1 TRINITY_DN1653_c0_g1~~TRINITY_DN1653_c0_g1_i7.p1  ORF type:complete len:167 (+),score=16.61 TRINITY_DN1653_c0_g1_i7:740-1240(+)